MPNWCFNILTLSGDVIKFVEDHGLDDSAHELDFKVVAPYPNGEWDYDWCVNNWGTKWEGNINYLDIAEDSITIHLETAWEPPVQWLYSASVKYPEVIFHLDACEEGVDFKGMYCVKNGEFLEHIEMSYLEYLYNENEVALDFPLMLSDICNIIKDCQHRHSVMKVVFDMFLNLDIEDEDITTYKMMPFPLQDFTPDEDFWQYVEKVYQYLVDYVNDYEEIAIKYRIVNEFESYYTHVRDKVRLISDMYRSYKIRTVMKIITYKQKINKDIIQVGLQPPGTLSIVPQGGALYRESLEHFALCL